MKISEAPHGINLVVETRGPKGPRLYIGRFDSTNGFQVVMHDCDVHDLAPGEDSEAYVRQTATYGIAVNQRDVGFEAASVQRVRVLGDIEKA